jgi:hypothetical protein
MTIRVTPRGFYEMVLRDDMTGWCSGPSTDSGIGSVVDAGRLVVGSITTACQDGRQSAGAGLLIFLHDPRTDMLSDNYGVVWRRVGA